MKTVTKKQALMKKICDNSTLDAHPLTECQCKKRPNRMLTRQQALDELLAPDRFLDELVAKGKLTPLIVNGEVRYDDGEIRELILSWFKPLFESKHSRFPWERVEHLEATA
jgi:hypothetical protein